MLAETPYSFKTRFENEKGTNPEELIAAAHAGCFTMALAFGLQAGGYTPTELTTEAAVTLEPEGQGFRISHSALTLRAKVPNLDETKFVERRETPRRTARSQKCSKPHHVGRQTDPRHGLADRPCMTPQMIRTHQPGQAVFKSILLKTSTGSRSGLSAFGSSRRGRRSNLPSLVPM